MAVSLRYVSAVACALTLYPAPDGTVLAQNAREKGGTIGGRPAALKKARTHRVVIQISQNDPALIDLALNNAENLSAHYAGRGETVSIEFVAYGPGLAMLRSDTSPVKDRLAALGEKKSNIVFSGCGNTKAAQGRTEGKEITLLPQARVVPAGIARIVELQEQGWRYVRP